MKLLSKLAVEGFRGMHDLKIDHLSQVNLIVGDNNCGKTSLLEAIQFLRSSGSIANIYRIARQRENTFAMNTNSIYDNILCMFPKCEGGLEIKLSAIYDGNAISFDLLGKESKELLDLNELDRLTRKEFAEANNETETDVLECQSVYTVNGKSTKETFRLNRFSRITGTQINQDERIKITYVSPFEHLKGYRINQIIKDDAYKEICVRALRLFDPDIEDMMIFKSDVGNRPVEYLKHKRLGNMPLSTYGDGIKKVLVLANAIVGAANGILLIDEIETAIHKKYYDDIFRFIVKACGAFNVQAFITTHSIEAIDGLLETQDYEKQNESDAITVVTLKRQDQKTYARVLSGREVYENREAFGFEVRI